MAALRDIGLAAVLAASALLAPTGGAADDSAGGTAKYLKTNAPAEVRLLPRVRIDGHLFGGLSGLAWDAATARLIAVSDRGDAFSLPMRRADDVERIARLALPRGFDDAEAIRRAPEGGWYVAFENGSAIAYYPGGPDALGRQPASTRKLPKRAQFSPNAGIESLAMLHFGRLLAIVEGGKDGRRDAWIIDGDRLIRRTYPAADGFDPTDAVALPNGDVLVLERRFNGLAPPFFSSRLARIPAASVDAPDGPFELLGRFDLAGVLPSENWEGMDVASIDEITSLWLVSDDNMRWPQNTLLARLPLEYVLESTARH